MNLKTKHILAVSAVAGIAGVIGYFIGHKVGYEYGYGEGYDNGPELNDVQEDDPEMVEAPPIFKKFFKGDHIPKSIIDHYDVVKTFNGYGLNKKEMQPEWSPSPFDVSMYKHIVGESLDNIDELVQKQQHKTYIKDYISEDYEEDTDDEEDIYNLATQGEVEYTSDEPYIIEESDAYSNETNVDDVDTLTYYRIDKVLSDSRDEIVSERKEIIGSIDLSLVKGPVVYIRNPRTRRDYEILIADTSYEKEVLGADDEQYLNAVKYFNIGDE